MKRRGKDDRDLVAKVLDSSKIVWQRGSEVGRPEMISTGLPFLDYAMSGGVPRGRITYWFGPERSGKSTLALSVADQAIKRYGEPVPWFDIERSFDREWAAHFVDDLDKVYVSTNSVNSPGGEAIADSVVGIIREAAPPLLVIDSLSALTTSRAFDRDWEKTLTGVDAAFNNRLVRMANVVNADTAVLVIGQYRSGYGDWDYIPGGYGIRHLSSIILEISPGLLRAERTDLVDDGDDPKRIAGVIARIRGRKSKLGPRRSAEEWILSKGMFDTFRSELTMRMMTGDVTQGGSWYALPNGTKVNGLTALRTEVAEHGWGDA